MKKLKLPTRLMKCFCTKTQTHLTLLNLWRWIEEQREQLTKNRWQTVLRKRFINPLRVREWRELASSAAA